MWILFTFGNNTASFVNKIKSKRNKLQPVALTHLLKIQQGNSQKLAYYIESS